MAGEDEARARATLVEMQRRISQGSHVALGVTEHASPEQVRAAFLQLTKVFHPARFGRMPAEVQKLSNEVFLGLKAAHESLLRTLGAPVRGTMHPNQSGGMPVVTAEGSSKFPARVAPGQPPPAVARTVTPGAPPARPPTPAYGVRVMPMRPTPAHGVRVQPMPSGSTPPNGVRATPAAPRPGTPNVGARPATPQSAPTAPKPAAPVEPEVQHALAMIAARDWAAAEQTVNRLRARDWTSKPYRALQFYLRGREAEVAGKSQEAAEAYDRALQLDPDQIHAKSALDELQRRR